MSEQTAVEYIEEYLRFKGIIINDKKMPQVLIGVIKFAKQMEKKQIIDAYKDGFKISGEGWNGEYGIIDFNLLDEEIETEKYYNEKFNKDEKTND